MLSAAQGWWPHADWAIADFQTSALCAHRVLENRLSPSRLGASSPELLHTVLICCRYLSRVLHVYATNWDISASDDIRSLQKAPKIVASAISQFVAYIYYMLI